MSTIRLNNELKSNIVKVIPPATNDMALKTINGMIDYLKKYKILYKNAINYPNEGDSYLEFYKNNPLIKPNYDTTWIDNKIDALIYLYAPITVEAVRTEINKLIEIFKTPPIIATEDDFEDMVQKFINDLKNLDFNLIDYGVASDVYLSEDIIEYGNAATNGPEHF